MSQDAGTVQGLGQDRGRFDYTSALVHAWRFPAGMNMKSACDRADQPKLAILYNRGLPRMKAMVCRDDQ